MSVGVYSWRETSSSRSSNRVKSIISWLCPNAFGLLLSNIRATSRRSLRLSDNASRAITGPARLCGLVFYAGPGQVPAGDHDVVGLFPKESD